MGFNNPIYKNEPFFLPKLTLQHHLHNICMAFYLLIWTYFNDVNGGRNILINSWLKRILFISSGNKKWNKTEKDRKNMEKENKTDGSDLVKMRYQIQILWSLLNLNERQTLEILIVAAVIIRGRRCRSSSLEVFCSWFCRKYVLTKHLQWQLL